MPAEGWSILPLAVRVQKRGWPAIWLPLFLLWPLVIVLFCLALPLSLLSPAPGRAVLAVLIASYRVLCALHGTQVEVISSEQSSWNISLY
jgi:hypothetical protein